MHLSGLVFIYSGQKRELFVVNTSVFVQSTISLKIKQNLFEVKKAITQKESGWLLTWLIHQRCTHWVEFWWCLSRRCP